MIEGAATLLDKITNLSLRGGVLLLLIGGFLHLGTSLGIIRKGALNGYVSDIAPVLWGIGLAVIFTAFAFSLVSWVGLNASKLWNNWADKREQRRRLLGNLAFLDERALILFYYFLVSPQGRLEANGNSTFGRLQELSLIHSENMSVIIAGPPKGMMQLSSALMTGRAKLAAQLEASFQSTHGLNIRNGGEVTKFLETSRRS